MTDSATVLVADDDDDILALVRMGLERAGHHVIPAHNGTQALQLAKLRTPDLCILDVAMPGLDGIRVTEELRSDSVTHGIPVILLTAHAQASDVARGIAAGANAYIPKPFRIQTLRQQVDSLLAERLIGG